MTFVFFFFTKTLLLENIIFVSKNSIPSHFEIKQTNVVFNFLGDFNIILKEELSDLAHKKDVTEELTNC